MAPSTSLKSVLLRKLYQRYMSWRLPELAAPAYPVMLEYAIEPKPRYGHGQPPHAGLHASLQAHDARYRETLQQLADYSTPLTQIAERADPARPQAPHWDNTYFSGLDAIALYGFLGLRKPARYFEIGSGNSTKFARRAIEDLHLQTRIISMDPAPRAEIDALCDEVIRQPLESADLRLFDELQPGDILFVDNSHRVFQNSDVTVFFLDVLPRLRSGVLVHIHDIFLPDDYPPSWISRHYSEQYMLAAMLLADDRRVRVVLPNAYLDRHAGMNALIHELWNAPVLARAFESNRGHSGGYLGTSFWFERA